jgi:hypothetical protein
MSSVPPTTGPPGMGPGDDLLYLRQPGADRSTTPVVLRPGGTMCWGAALATIADRSAALLDQHGVAVEVQRPALRPVDTPADRFPTGTMPVEVPVLQLYPGAGR